MDSRPIGIFDSGLGGLTLFHAVRELLPCESLTYLGDGKSCPYGDKSRAEVERLSRVAVERLLKEEGCKMIVVACNTATAAAIEPLRRSYPEVNIVGLEPAVKPACLATRSGVVGVLATQGSLEGDLYHRTAAKYSAEVRIIEAAGRGFVEAVEADREQSEEAERMVREVVEPMLRYGADQIVLGCTHYPFLMDVLRRVAPEVNIIDPSPAVARRVRELLMRGDMLAEEGAEARYKFITFADENYRQRLERKAMMLQKKITSNEER